jgi:hypothetical protein
MNPAPFLLCLSGEQYLRGKLLGRGATESRMIVPQSWRYG